MIKHSAIEWVALLIAARMRSLSFWEFKDRLERFVAQHLAVRLQRRVGPEDIV